MPTNFSDGKYVHFHNIDIVIRNIVAVGNGAPKYVADVLGRCMHEDVWKAWVKQISLTDHSLEDLRKLGHPYSRGLGANSFVHPDEEVHIQSGDLLQHSYIDVIEGAGNTTVGYRLLNNSEHYVDIRYGTMKMRPRDPGGAALREALPALRARFASEVKHAVVEIFAR